MKSAHQAQAEYRAGYRHGMEGGSEPKPEKGAAHYGGWLAGYGVWLRDNEVETLETTT